MIMYASYTGTRRNKRALREHGWRMLMSPDTFNGSASKRAPRWDDDTPAPYALDNGAWGCHQRGVPFNGDAFQWTYDRIGAGADWVVAPDIVGGGLESLELTELWLDRLTHPLVLIAVQDGMEPEDVGPLMGPGRGLFLGGSTEWKLRTLAQWGNYARQVGCYYHVARVNTIKRYRACQYSGVHSIDGSRATRWSMDAGVLPSAARQLCLFNREVK